MIPKTAMSLLIPVLAFLEVLLYTQTGSVGAAAVTYYVTPSAAESPSRDCPLGEPCETLDDYASNITGYFASGNDNVTMMFLSGNHTSTICFSYFCPSASRPCLELTMVGLRDDVEIHLRCDFTLSYVKILTMSNLTIHGNEEYGVILREAPVVGMALNGVTFVSALLYFGGHLSSRIALSNIHFEASWIEMEF